MTKKINWLILLSLLPLLTMAQGKKSFTLDDLLIHPSKSRSGMGTPMKPHVAPNPLPRDAGLEY